jgi:uncharacterized protein (DUF2147 family)
MKQRLMRALAALLLLAGISSPAFAAPPNLTGYWDTGTNQAVTQIYPCGDNLLCGELVGFPMDHPTDPMPETWNHQPQCHFVFIRYLQNAGDSWNGTIINPRSGNNYGVAVQLASPDQLKLRGYILFQMLGATRLWNRYNGPPPPADCRMAPHSLG